VELRGQARLARVLRGSDVRAIIAGHLHYSTFATFAGIPVSVASSTCYAQDLTVPVGGTRPQDGGQSYNLIHVFDDAVVHSVVPVAVQQVMEYTDPEAARRRLSEAGLAGVSVRRRSDPPTRPLPVLR
jgi:Icc protein